MWTPVKGGAGLARLFALETIVKGAVYDLNDAIKFQPDINYLVTKFGPLDPAKAVNIGDLITIGPLSDGFIQIRVSNAGWREGLDFTSERAYIEGDTKDTFYTAVFAYMHPLAFRNQGSEWQMRQMTIAQELTSDWLRARVLNFVGFINGVHYDWRDFRLTSQERYSDGQLDGNGNQLTDQLSDCIVTTGNKGWFQRNFGAENLFGIQFIHRGVLLG